MARIKYATGITPLSKSVEGFTFKINQFGQTLKKKNSQRHNFSALQKEMSGILLQVSRAWKDLTFAEQTNWFNFVTALPQPSKRNFAVKLSDYHNFVKRNFFLLLKNGISSDLMKAPNSTYYYEDLLSASAILTEISLSLDLTFARSANDLDIFLFVSFTPFQSRELRSYYDRFMYAGSNVNATINITQKYLQRFGKLPTNKDFLHLFVISLAKLNGQFFFKQFLKIPVPKKNPINNVKYGFLYNAFTIFDSRNIATENFRVPTLCDWAGLLNTLEDPVQVYPPCGNFYETAAHFLKETGSEYWNENELPATNSIDFNARGASWRHYTLAFNDPLKSYTAYFTSNIESVEYQLLNVVELYSNYTDISNVAQSNFNSGISIRLVSDNCPSGLYTGNDGKQYYAKKMKDGKYWLDCNLAETKFENGDYIAGFENGIYRTISNIDYEISTIAMLCAFDNDINNAYS